MSILVNTCMLSLQNYSLHVKKLDFVQFQHITEGTIILNSYHLIIGMPKKSSPI
jgi:hypothetical protein